VQTKEKWGYDWPLFPRCENTFHSGLTTVNGKILDCVNFLSEMDLIDVFTIFGIRTFYKRIGISTFLSPSGLNRGCQIFIGTTHQNVPKDHKIHQRTITCSKCIYNTKRLLNIPNFFISTPFKLYQNCYFWNENKPSGNPGLNNISWLKCFVTL
jgi:hypothetical protein